MERLYIRLYNASLKNKTAFESETHMQSRTSSPGKVVLQFLFPCLVKPRIFFRKPHVEHTTYTTIVAQTLRKGKNTSPFPGGRESSVFKPTGSFFLMVVSIKWYFFSPSKVLGFKAWGWWLIFKSTKNLWQGNNNETTKSHTCMGSWNMGGSFHGRLHPVPPFILM